MNASDRYIPKKVHMFFHFDNSAVRSRYMFPKELFQDSVFCDIVWVNFDPSSGNEIKKRRPGLVVSRYEFNRSTLFAVICPITSTIKKHLLLDIRCRKKWLSQVKSSFPNMLCSSSTTKTRVFFPSIAFKSLVYCITLHRGQNEKSHFADFRLPS